MAKTKVIVDLSRESDADAIIKTDEVLSKLAANVATYANPIITLLQMKHDRDDFEAKAIAAQHGGKEATTAKDLAREVLDSNYRVNGNYVNSVANGDKAKCLLSGYELAKVREKTVLADFEMQKGKNSGDVVIFCRQNPKKLIIKLIQCTYDPATESTWVLEAVTKKKKTSVKNKEAGKRLWARFALVMDENVFEYSDPISFIVV